MVSLNKFKSQLGKFVYHYIIKYIVTQCSEKKIQNRDTQKNEGR